LPAPSRLGARCSPEADQGLVVRYQWAAGRQPGRLHIAGDAPIDNADHAAEAGCRICSPGRISEADTGQSPTIRLMQSSAMHRAHESFGSPVAFWSTDKLRPARLRFSTLLLAPPVLRSVGFSIGCIPVQRGFAVEPGPVVAALIHSVLALAGALPATRLPSGPPSGPSLPELISIRHKMAQCLRSVRGAGGACTIDRCHAGLIRPHL
jgi:hypothetical protein